jgi:CRP-like cAMP-binding protein
MVQPYLEAVPLPLRTELEAPNTPIEHVFFMESGMGSVVAISATGQRLEVGVIGREGMSGSTIVMGNDRSPHESFIQVEGNAQRIRSDDLRNAMQQSSTLRPFLMHYVQAFTIQTAHTALANGRSKLEDRLARWLLMCHDRADGDELPLTHEFLALMLGVRRTGVTLALHLLEARGLIKSKRSRIVIVDREGLEEAAAGSYGTPEAEYRRLVG